MSVINLTHRAAHETATFFHPSRRLARTQQTPLLPAAFYNVWGGKGSLFGICMGNQVTAAPHNPAHARVHIFRMNLINFIFKLII